MKVYLTGGALRDELLNRPATDKDFIVAGVSERELMAKGFLKVGNNYDTFLHPETREEYVISKEENLKEELERRDLTINSMAKDTKTGELIDPFDGKKDLNQKILRHTSMQFIDDPIRILRLARFKAKFSDFSIHPETEELCKKQCLNENLFKDIPGERFKLEIEKALLQEKPEIFFETLKEIGALDLFFPELARLEGVEQNPKYHPEGDSFIHTMQVLKATCELSKNFTVRFSALVHDLGKGLTPKEELPSHIKHEGRGLSPIKDVCSRFKIDSKTTKLALTTCKNHLKVHKTFELRASTIFNLLEELNAFRKGDLFQNVLICCHGDFWGKGKNLETRPDYSQASFLKSLKSHLDKTPVEDLIYEYKGKKLGEKIRERQIASIKSFRKSYDI